MTAPIMAAGTWATNAELIADVAALGYLHTDWRTLDPTWGLGRFWTLWRPAVLVGSDLDATKSPTGTSVDATALPHDDHSFDAVVLDPPYKLNGTDRGEGERYGVAGAYSSARDRVELALAMVGEAARVVRPATRSGYGGIVAVKCQDQVNAGRVVWQTDLLTRHAETLGLVKVDALHMPSYRAQPAGTSQRHARRNYSTLLVFRRPMGRPATGRRRDAVQGAVGCCAAHPTTAPTDEGPTR